MRITRTIADDTATKMAREQFDKKMEELRNKQYEFNEGIAKKYIPSEVIKIAKKYPDFIASGCSLLIVSEGFWSMYISTKGIYPTSEKAIKITREEYISVKKIIEDINTLSQKKGDLENRISDTLFALKTLNNVQDNFPEAVKYIEISDKKLPAIQINDLRDMFK